ncbi:MAG TPA: hypothetical protein VKV19_14775 [Ktedonobacteraceae bacterium]|nr:hypothetical protein [Ktedonobacteraceae bacterium]
MSQASIKDSRIVSGILMPIQLYASQDGKETRFRNGCSVEG